MLVVIFIALAILPLSALIFGTLFFIHKNIKVSLPAFLAAGFMTLFVDFYFFYKAYQLTLDSAQWAPAAGTMGMFSVFASVNCFAFGLLAGMIFAKQGVKKLAPVLVLVIATVTLQVTSHLKFIAEQKNLAQASGELTPELVQEILAENNLSLTTTLLLNPNLPETVLKDFSQKEEVIYRITVLKNPNVSSEIVETLAKDNNDVVRYHVVINPKTSLVTLEVLTKDPAKDVRTKARSMLENRKKQ